MALLDPNTLKEDYDSANTAMRPLWDSFDEYERISRNKPHPKVVSAKLPTVTDGTLAGVIASQPKRVVQQIPTGGIKSLVDPDLAEIVDYIWLNEILPNANYNGTMLQKSWIMIRKALTYGMQASYAFYKNSGDYFGADFSLPYIRDIILERGKSYGPDCDVLYLRQWYTKNQIKLIIEKETKLGDKAKKRGEKYDGSWDVKALKDLLETAAEKSADAQTPAERDKPTQSPLIEVIHAFQVGVGAKFYSFAPALTDKSNIIRTKTNPDPRGKMPISFLYADVDLSNPLGVGYVEMSGGMQNLLDSEVQSYQLTQKLMLNPPLMKWGRGIKGVTVKYKPNAVWDMGSDPNSKIEPVNINNEAIANFPNNYGLIKSQILNLSSGQDSSVSGQVSGGANQSKTPQGVQQQNQRIGFDDNYIRKQFERWFEDNAETMINIHFAESSGVREVELTKDFLESKAEAVQQSQAIDIKQANQTALVDFDKIQSSFTFTVDPTSSESPDDAHQTQVLQQLLTEMQSAPYLPYYLVQAGYKLNMGEAYKQMLQLLGLSDIDKILVELPKDGTAQEYAKNLPNPFYDKPSVRISYPDLPPAAQVAVLSNAGVQVTLQDVMAGPVVDPNMRGVETPLQDGTAQLPMPNPALQPQPQPQPGQPVQGQPQGPAQSQAPQLSNEDKLLAAHFLKAGYSPQQALHAVTLANNGVSEDQIAHAIGLPKGGQ